MLLLTINNYILESLKIYCIKFSHWQRSTHLVEACLAMTSLIKNLFWTWANTGWVEYCFCLIFLKIWSLIIMTLISLISKLYNKYQLFSRIRFNLIGGWKPRFPALDTIDRESYLKLSKVLSCWITMFQLNHNMHWTGHSEINKMKSLFWGILQHSSEGDNHTNNCEIGWVSPEKCKHAK